MIWVIKQSSLPRKKLRNKTLYYCKLLVAISIEKVKQGQFDNMLFVMFTGKGEKVSHCFVWEQTRVVSREIKGMFWSGTNEKKSKSQIKGKGDNKEKHSTLEMFSSYRNLRAKGDTDSTSGFTCNVHAVWSVNNYFLFNCRTTQKLLK